MSQSSTPIATRIEEYWDWFAVALFVLITVDMLTTMFAGRVVGHQAEANPLIRWALGQGVLTLTVINLVAAVVAVTVFYNLIQILKRTAPPYDRFLEVSIEVWLALLISTGLFVFANNLMVIVHGRSLL